MFIYNNLTPNEFLEIMNLIESYHRLDDPCYLGQLKNCDNCGNCLDNINGKMVKI